MRHSYRMVIDVLVFDSLYPHYGIEISTFYPAVLISFYRKMWKKLHSHYSSFRHAWISEFGSDGSGLVCMEYWGSQHKTINVWYIHMQCNETFILCLCDVKDQITTLHIMFSNFIYYSLYIYIYICCLFVTNIFLMICPWFTCIDIWVFLPGVPFTCMVSL